MILDLIVLAILVLVGFIAYKVGFLTSLLKMASGLSGLIIAIVFVSPITNFVTTINLDKGMETTIYENIVSSDAFVAYTDGGAGVEGLTQLLDELGVPGFLSEFIAKGIADSIDPLEVASVISDKVSYAVVFVIVFFALLLLSSLTFFILKSIVKETREAIGFFRVVDGVFGILLYVLIYVVILYILLAILAPILNSIDPNSGFAIFMDKQLHLDDGKFGITKYLYENNVIRNFFELIF